MLAGRQQAALPDQHGIGQRIAAGGDGDGRRDDLGQRQRLRIGGIFGDRALHAGRVAHRDGRRIRGEDEDAVGRAGIAVAGRGLEIEAVAVDRGDDARGGDDLADIVGRMALTLDRADVERDRIVIDDGAGRFGAIDDDVAAGGAQAHGQRLIALAHQVALHRHDNLLDQFARREGERARKHSARAKIVGAGGAGQFDGIVDRRFIGLAAGAAHGEDHVAGAGVAFHQAGVLDAQIAGAVGGQDALAGVERAEAFRPVRHPAEVRRARSRAGQLQRQARCGRRVLRHADVGAGHAGCRGAGGGGEAALIGKELKHGAVGRHQGEAVAGAILDARAREGQRAKAIAFVVDHARQGQRVIDHRRVGGVGAIVEDDPVAGQVGARRARNLDRLARVGADIVIVDFVDKDIGRRRRRRGVVILDRAGRAGVRDGRAAGRVRKGQGESVVAFEIGVALNRQANFRAGGAIGEADRAAGRLARREVGGVGRSVERQRPGRRNGARAAAAAADGEDDLLRAAIAFDDAGVRDRQRARLRFGIAAAEALAGIGVAGGRIGDQRPAEIVDAVAGADEADRGAVFGAAFQHAHIDAGHARGRAVGGDEAAFPAEELNDIAGRVDERDAIGFGAGGVAVLNAVRRIGDADRAETVLLIGDDAAQRLGAVGAAIAGAAIVEDDRPAGDIRAGQARDLDEFAAIGAGIVIMDFIDEDVGCHRNSPQATGDADPSHRIDSHD